MEAQQLKITSIARLVLSAKFTELEILCKAMAKTLAERQHNVTITQIDTLCHKLADMLEYVWNETEPK